MNSVLILFAVRLEAAFEPIDLGRPARSMPVLGPGSVATIARNEYEAECLLRTLCKITGFKFQ
jgi:hypothetical protein